MVRVQKTNENSKIRITNITDIEVDTGDGRIGFIDSPNGYRVGRPRSKKTEKVTIVMEPEDLKAFRQLCFENGMGMSEYVKLWLHRELKHRYI